jgi:hypothetical protein
MPNNLTMTLQTDGTIDGTPIDGAASGDTITITSNDPKYKSFKILRSGSGSAALFGASGPHYAFGSYTVQFAQMGTFMVHWSQKTVSDPEGDDKEVGPSDGTINTTTRND